MDVVDFGRALNGLTVDDIRLIAQDLAAASVSTADEVAVTRSVLVIEQMLRRTHRLPNAATAALGAASTVQDVASRARVALPDRDVTRVARAAAQLARGLVVGDNPRVEDAVLCLGKGWHRLPCCADLAGTLTRRAS
jgi:hypothetical protein